MPRTTIVATPPSLHAGLLVASAAALGLSGCAAECQAWDTLEVDTSALAEPAEPLARFQQGLDQFIEWTGRDATCVQGVTLGAELTDALGRYVVSSQTIEIIEDAPSSTTTHELCHALDHEEGWASERAGPILEPLSRNYSPTLYRSENERIHEAFARFCEEGPHLAAFLEKLHQTCGIEGPWEAAAYVRDIAFPDADRSAGWSELVEPFSFETSTAVVPDSARVADYRAASGVSGATGIFVLDNLLFEDETTGEGRIEPTLHLLDRDTHAIVDSLALAPHGPGRVNGNPIFSEYTLVGSSTAPILYAFTGENAGTAWRIESDPLRLESVSWPAMEEGAIPHGFEHDGLAYIRTSPSGPVLLVDLEADTIKPVETDAALSFDASRTEATFADERGAVAVYRSPDGMALVELDWDGQWTSMSHLPIPSGRVRFLTHLADGSIVVTPVVSGEPSDGMVPSFAVSVRHDPETGTWAAAEGDCVGLVGDGWFVSGDENLSVVSEGTAEAGFDLRVVTARF